jgi:hypothetical protein
MRDHRHEIPLQLGEVLLMREFFAEHRGLLSECPLTEGQFDRLVTKHYDCACHFADFIAALDPLGIDVHLGPRTI